MQRLSFVIFSFCAFIFTSFAQNETDALRYSLINPGGTARFISTGGAFGALGGDFSTLSTNPAGIAVYRGSEFTITPNLNFSRVESSYYGTWEDDFKYDFNIGNIGIVFAFNDPNQLKETGWVGFQLGFGMNRHMNFNNQKVYQGYNTHSSLMTHYLDEIASSNISPSNPVGFDPFTTELAWETFLIDIDETTGEFFADMEYGNVLQRRETNSSGAIREMVLTLGANYSNRLYMGATFGFPSVRFEEEFTYTEKDTENINPVFNSMEYRQTLKTTGTGFNFKFGMIYRASDMVRLGAAVHTPTFYDLEDDWRSSMKSDLNYGDGRYEATSPRGRFNYSLDTPLKFTGSLGLVFGTLGLFSIDYEYADFTTMRLRSSEYSFSDENNTIRSNFTTQHNIRVGGEARLDPIILRAGYSFYSNPYEEGVNKMERNTLSAGIGIRDRSYFVDFGYFYTQYSEDFYPYDATLTQAVNYDYSRNGFLMTIGFRF